jgi:hypothetical protein
MGTYNLSQKCITQTETALASIAHTGELVLVSVLRWVADFAGIVSGELSYKSK